MARSLSRAAVIGILALLLNGCFLAANREINLLVIRTDTGGSEVTVTYRVPPPKQGKVYVLWLLNPDIGKTVRVGTVEPTSRLRAIKTQIDFWATAAIISIETDAAVDHYSDTWALVSGETSPVTRTRAGTPAR